MFGNFLAIAGAIVTTVGFVAAMASAPLVGAAAATYGVVLVAAATACHFSAHRHVLGC